MSFILLIFLLLVLLAFCGGTTNCPTGCYCNDDTLAVVCQQTSLDVLPITLNPIIKRLIIRDNKIKVIDNSIQFYTELQYLDLSQNNLTNVPPRIFAYQYKLQELHLNQNKISSLNNTSFQGLDSLIVLNLKQNFLEELTEGTFAILSKLEELNLGQNRISKIEPRAFGGLSALRTLYLDDNQLSSVPTTSLSPLRNLVELHIGRNAFSYIPEDAFAGLDRLTVLDLNSLNFNNISEFAFRGISVVKNLTTPVNYKAPVTILQPASKDYGKENRLLLQISMYVIGGVVCGILIGTTVLIACKYRQNKRHINFEECTLDGSAELYEFPNMFYMNSDPWHPHVETFHGPVPAPEPNVLPDERFQHPPRILNGLRCYENIYEDIEPYDTIDSSSLPQMTSNNTSCQCEYMQ